MHVQQATYANELHMNVQQKRLELRKLGYPGNNNTADQGHSKEVYYFAGGFYCTVWEEYHISTTRKHENYTETSPTNAMDPKS